MRRIASIRVRGQVEVRSTCINAVQHDNVFRRLLIRFKSGDYYFYGVKKATATRLMRAKSPGRFFHRNIAGKYESEKVLVVS
ncbi:MAG: KTSC domain-containing protein [bacterium]